MVSTVLENDHYEPREFHLKYIDKVFVIKAVITKTAFLRSVKGK